MAADYEGYITCKAFTGPAFQRLALAAAYEMQDGLTATEVREAAAIAGLDQSPVQLAKIHPFRDQTNTYHTTINTSTLNIHHK